MGMCAVAVRAFWSRRHMVSASLLALALGAGMGGAAPRFQPDIPSASAWSIPLYAGVSRPSDVRELAFAVRGRVGECLIAPGDEVRQGQLLMRLEDGVQCQTIRLAHLQAEDQTSLLAAIRTAEFRAYDLGQMRAAHAEGGSNDRELADAEYREAMARADVEGARQNLAQSAVALAREEARLAEMTILSPIDGTIVDVHRRAGEGVDESTNVATIIRIDPLWIDVNVSMSDALRLRVGQRASVGWEDVGDRAAEQGRVIFVSPAGHAGARQVMVRVEVPNPDGLPAGMHAAVRFLGPDASASGARTGVGGG